MSRTTWSYPFGRYDRLRLHPRYAYLRANDPVARVRMPYGEPGWLVTGYHNARAVLADTRFSRAPGRDEPRTSAEVHPGGLMSMDPPDHTRLRRMVSRAFTAVQVEQLRARAREIADDLVDAMIRTGPPVDLIQSFALPLPLTLVCEMLGVDYPEDRRFAAWSQVVVTADKLSASKIREYNGRLGVYMTRLVKEHRRRDAGAGLLDELIGVRDSGGPDRGNPMTEDELVHLGVMLLTMAYENTTTELANFAYVLMTEAAVWTDLVSHPQLVPTAVEELTRYIPIATFAEFPRYATERVELDGGVIPAGEPVLVSLAAADRDERVFHDPERLDLRRHPNPHLGFSHGVHHCLGAPLARMEIQTCLDTLIRRLPTMKLAVAEEEIGWKRGLLIRGPRTLPVTW